MNSLPLISSASHSLATSAPAQSPAKEGGPRSGHDPEREPSLVEALLREWFQIGELTVDQLQRYLAAIAQR